MLHILALFKGDFYMKKMFACICIVCCISIMMFSSCSQCKNASDEDIGEFKGLIESFAKSIGMNVYNNKTEDCFAFECVLDYTQDDSHKIFISLSKDMN